VAASRAPRCSTIGFGFSLAAGALPQPPQLLQPEPQPPAVPPRRGTKRRSAKPSATSTPPPTMAGSIRA
jgi:hypothetical protein